MAALMPKPGIYCGIYYIKNPSGNVYIGSSKDIRRRWTTYRGLRCRGQPAIYRSLMKYGVDSHEFSVIELCAEEHLADREQMYLDFYQPALNASKNTRAFMRGRKFTQEHKDRISAALKGRKMTKEQVEKNRKAQTGKVMSEECRRKKSEAMLGKKHSQESIAKMRAIAKARGNNGVSKNPATNLKRSTTMSRKRWWNNGTETRRAEECPGPEWNPGRKLRED